MPVHVARDVEGRVPEVLGEPEDRPVVLDSDPGERVPQAVECALLAGRADAPRSRLRGVGSQGVGVTGWRATARGRFCGAPTSPRNGAEPLVAATLPRRYGFRLRLSARSPSLIRISPTVCSISNQPFLASVASAGRARTNDPSRVDRLDPAAPFEGSSDPGRHNQNPFRGSNPVAELMRGQDCRAGPLGQQKCAIGSCDACGCAWVEEAKRSAVQPSRNGHEPIAAEPLSRDLDARLCDLEASSPLCRLGPTRTRSLGQVLPARSSPSR